MKSMIGFCLLRVVGALRSHSFETILLSLAALHSASAQAQTPEREVFAPASGRGSIVIAVTGQSGPVLYRDYSAKLAEQGYHVVLVSGNDISIPGKTGPGIANLRRVMLDAQSAASAIAGKVALVGFSVGGIGVLGHGAPLKEQVSAIVLYYPAISFVSSQLKQFASAMQAPTLVFAGAKDQFSNCCLIETMRALEQEPKSVAFQLVVYPDAGHGFNLDAPSLGAYRKQDADDAWARTLAFLREHHPARP
ncbi:MAG: dienelactone hydrolase family protein [Chitinophagaceae bacterium]|nr:dienelactone hydrolase family protein [Rubrivivax sp.]